MALFKKEERKFPRITPGKNRPITVNINGKNFLEIVQACDISEDGIGITVPNRLNGCDINSVVSVVLTLPEPYKHSLRFKGKIRHISKNSFGVLFLEISRSDRRLVKSYIALRLENKPWYIKLNYKVQHILAYRFLGFTQKKLLKPAHK